MTINRTDLVTAGKREPLFKLGADVLLVCEEDFGIGFLPVVVLTSKLTLDTVLYTVAIVNDAGHLVELYEDGEIEEQYLANSIDDWDPDRPVRQRPKLSIVK